MQLITRHSTLCWFLAVVITFGCVETMSIHIGDDMGYLFTDSVHHNCDGHAVRSLGDIIDTQINHWHTTNGRFVVHALVMAMLNLVPLWVYRVINSLMFGLLWLLMVRFVQGNRQQRPSAVICALCWLAAWLCLPQPVLLFTTLVAYAVNYLWVSVAMLAFLLLLRTNVSLPWLCMAAFAVATLHEGASLPVLCGLGLSCVWQRKISPWIVIAFAVGSAICAVAPGNLAHAAQGAPLLFKLKALGAHLSHSVITLWMVVMAVWAVRDRQSAWTFTCQNIVMTTAIFAALGMAALTYTAPRQLMLPSIFATILLLKIVVSLRLPAPRTITTIASLLTLLTITIVVIVRKHVYDKYNSFMHHYAAGNVISYAPGSDTSAWLDRNTGDVLSGYAPDPLLNRGMGIIGDRYSIQGLRRTVSKTGGGVLPYDKEFIVAHTDTTFAPTYSADSLIVITASQKLGLFSITVVPLDRNLVVHDNLSPRVVFTHNTHKYYISSPRDSVKFMRKRH